MPFAGKPFQVVLVAALRVALRYQPLHVCFDIGDRPFQLALPVVHPNLKRVPQINTDLVPVFSLDVASDPSFGALSQSSKHLFHGWPEAVLQRRDILLVRFRHLDVLPIDNLHPPIGSETRHIAEMCV